MVMHLEDPGVKTKVIEREVKIYQGRKIPGLVLKERQSRKFSSLGLYVHRDYALKRFKNVLGSTNVDTPHKVVNSKHLRATDQIPAWH